MTGFQNMWCKGRYRGERGWRAAGQQAGVAGGPEGQGSLGETGGSRHLGGGVGGRLRGLLWLGCFFTLTFCILFVFLSISTPGSWPE